jgi:hypothetical protein
MSNVLKVRAVIVGGAYGKINVKYVAVESVMQSKILAAINIGITKDGYEKKNFTVEELTKHFSASPFIMEIAEVKMPEFVMPVVGQQIQIGSKSSSLF